MNIAAMNVKISFQKSSVVTDEIGNHTNEWVDYFSCYATVSDKTAHEADTAGQTVTSERMDFTVRYCSETAAVTSTGHINAMADNDRILRHALSYVDTPDGERVPSLARVIYEKYLAYQGMETGTVPQTGRSGFFYLPYTAEPGNYYDGVSIADSTHVRQI